VQPRSTDDKFHTDPQRTSSTDTLSNSDSVSLQNITVLTESQLGTELVKLCETSDGEVLFVLEVVEETRFGFGYGREDVRFALTVSLKQENEWG
jgi:hypothetical protein